MYCLSELHHWAAFTPSVIKTVENLPAALVTCVDMQLLADTSCCALNLVSLGNNKMAKMAKNKHTHTAESTFQTVVCLICKIYIYIYMKKKKFWPEQKQPSNWMIQLLNCGMWLLLGSLGKFLCLQDISQPTQLNNGILSIKSLDFSQYCIVSFYSVSFYSCTSVICSEFDLYHQWWSSWVFSIQTEASQLWC